MEEREDYDSNIKFKTCRKCGKRFPLNSEYFYKDKTKKYGYCTQCKICKKQYKIDNNEKLRNYHKSYYKNNTKYFREYYTGDNYKKHREYMRKYALKYYKKIKLVNPEKYIWLNNKEYNRKQCQKYAKTEKGKIVNFKKRVKRRSCNDNKNVITSEQWIACKHYFNDSCAYCGNDANKLEKEHYLAISKGGASDVSNIIPACKSCNSSKRDRDFDTWYRNNSNYDKNRELKIKRYLELMNELQNSKK